MILCRVTYYCVAGEFFKTNVELNVEIFLKKWLWISTISYQIRGIFCVCNASERNWKYISELMLKEPFSECTVAIIRKTNNDAKQLNKFVDNNQWIV